MTIVGVVGDNELGLNEDRAVVADGMVRHVGRKDRQGAHAAMPELSHILIEGLGFGHAIRSELVFRIASPLNGKMLAEIVKLGITNPMVGTCALCLTKNCELRESHYMPAALYPKNQKLEMLPRVQGQTGVEEMFMPLLCGVCEERFNKRGESEVLRHLAAKIANKPSPLVPKLDALTARYQDETMKSYCGSDAGLNMDMFAYFGLSMAWRGIHSWPRTGRPDLTPIRLGLYEEPIRRFLAEETMDFPAEALVIVIVCTDKISREAWIPPTQCDTVWYHDIHFIAFGVLFRILLGRSIDDVPKIESCHSAEKRIHVGDVSRKTRQSLAHTESLSS
jgi:hypothetical protein